MKTIRAIIAASALLLAGHAQAASFNLDPSALPGQSTFDGLSKDLGALIWMNPSNSAEPHSAGLIPVGVQAALEVSSLTINPDDQHWQLMGLDLPSALPLPRLRLSAGIPFGLDVSYMVLSMPDSNVKMTGFEGRMAFGGFIPVPMLEANVRLYQSSLTGVTDLEVKSSGFAAMVGANLPIVKPYIEVGSVTTTSTPSGPLSILLSEYESTDSTLAVGAKVQLALFVINVEKSTVGDKDLTSVKIGFEF